MRVVIRILEPRDGPEFIAAVRRSRKLHRPYVHPPSTVRTFQAYLVRSMKETNRTFVARLKGPGDLVGVVSVSEIVYGTFQSAYLGYYGFTPHAGKGLMSEAVRWVVEHAFRTLKLHRLEANIQPGNRASIALAKHLGFKREGFSPRYLKIGGRWQDHERWAVLREDWTR
jgi:ribosomal-protein-alanine N-acetyltransferase